MAEDRIITANEKTAAALERIATALEQMALDGTTRAAPTWNQPDGLPTGDPPLPTPPPDLSASVSVPIVNQTVPLPPVQPAPFQFTGPSAFCPVHRVPWKTVPAGTSKRTGAAYSAFLACPERGCNERPQAPR